MRSVDLNQAIIVINEVKGKELNYDSWIFFKLYYFLYIIFITYFLFLNYLNHF